MDFTTPSFEAQLQSLSAEIKGGDAGEVLPPSPEKKTEDDPIEAEDIEGLIEIPFDITSLATDFEGWELTEKEKKILTRLYLKPIQKIAERYGNIRLILAVSTTLSIIGGKFLEYRMHLADKARNERERKDQLNKG